MTTLVQKLRHRDPVRFFKEHKAYESLLTDPTPDPVLHELRQRGICILPDHVPPSEVAAIRAEVEGPLRALHAGGEGVPGRSTAYPQFGTYVLHRVQDHFDACRRFAQDEWILDIVDRYSQGRGRSYSTVAGFRAEPRRNEQVDDWHTDTWRFRFKAMLYLGDVTADNAPLRYLAGSHTGASWRWSKFMSSYVAHSAADTAVAHRLRARAAAGQADNPRLDPVVCTGQAGTVILFDTRGVHGGTTLRDGERFILNHTFVDREDLTHASLE
jgi:hypothetical protein